MSKLAVMKELWDFLRNRRKWWLTGIVIVLVLLGAVIIIAEGSALSPFIYALF